MDKDTQYVHFHLACLTISKRIKARVTARKPSVVRAFLTLLLGGPDRNQDAHHGKRTLVAFRPEMRTFFRVTVSQEPRHGLRLNDACLRVFQGPDAGSS